MIAAAHSAALRGETRYTDVDGTPEMKQAVRAALLRDHQLSYAQDEIIICNGSTQAQFNALAATLEPGDEVIVPTPYWAPYLDQVRLLGGTPVVVRCPQNNGFRLRPEDLRAAITPRTRWLVINNPVNPSGAVYRREDLAEIAAVLSRHPGVWVMADGLYEHIVFDGDHAPTLAEIEPRLQPRTLTVSGVAKSYAMMGWRVGYAAGRSRSSRRPLPAPHRSARPPRLQRSTGAAPAAGAELNPARQARPPCRTRQRLRRTGMHRARRHVLPAGVVRRGNRQTFARRREDRKRPRLRGLPAAKRRSGGFPRRGLRAVTGHPGQFCKPVRQN